ncbi:hypothetical protein F0L74_10660 [Chitinophaga agrisoli]|uniref:Uncharacterized protein n=1 Tax=Chitinophaga agrisoli TaxID=2607653 RepID=A0A5B2VW48_9BACT|nr:hypothetical protein [Chitinophaga agrisoli]KAA2242974.1 hypothetical protein F0L74_10660 [Chitinophaga agrisoli]
MRYLNWKKLTIFFVSLLACFFAETVYVFSCGPEPDPYDYFTSFYNPNISSDKGFAAFYYAPISIFYGLDEPEEAANLREWESFFSGKGGKVTEADIRTFIYTYDRSQMAALYKYIDKGAAMQAPDSVNNNTLTRYFISSKDLETLGYLMYAKQCEDHSANEEVWSMPAPDSAVKMRLARNGLQLYNACKDPHIRERFAFQAVRMAHYSKNFETAIHYYDSLAAPIQSSSLIHYKALALKAGALLRTGNRPESAYWFSRVFEGAPSQRTLTYVNTGWTGVDKLAVLRQCKDNTEKATVAAMYAARTVEADESGIREVYRLDPASPMLEVLLAREVNKIEEGYLQTTINITGQPNYWSTGTGLHTAVVKSMQTLTDSIAALGKVKDPALWQITSAYLSFMQKDFAGAHARLAAAKPHITQPDQQDQWQMIQLLLNINEQPRIDKAYEQQLLASFKWLDTKLPKTEEDRWSYWDAPSNNKWINSAFYQRAYRDLLDQLIAPRYGQQGDIVRKALILAKRDSVTGGYNSWYIQSAQGFIEDSMQSAQLLALSDFYKRKGKTPFEQYLCNHLRMTERQIGEAIAINYVREHDFDNAVTWFKRSGSTRISETVFQEQLEDFGYEDRDSIRNGMSELEYATRMADMEKQIKKGKASPQVYYQYATGLFSISYYGHSYQFSASYRPSTWWYGPEHERTPFLREYFGCYGAEEYYKKAADAATDPEFKAKALYMAARCAQKHITLADKEEWWSPAIYKNPYFPQLVKDYSNTAFYKERLQECGYLRDFVQKQ